MAGSIDGCFKNNSSTPSPRSNNSDTTTNTSSLDHKFEGWSVWLEIDQKDHPHLAKQCEKLHRRYQHRQGVDRFVPHVTLLYNLPPFDDSDKSETNQQRAERLLKEAKRSFREQQQNEPLLAAASTKQQGKEQQISIKQEEEQNHPSKQCHSTALGRCPLMTPTDFYFFHYPKSADNGKGFGCVISMLLIKKEEWLSLLHSLVQDYFPKDERGGSFTPHLSLVYAPEDDLESLQMVTIKLKEERATSNLLLLQQPIPVRFLSLWSTEGAIQDWYRIARVEL